MRVTQKNTFEQGAFLRGEDGFKRFHGLRAHCIDDLKERVAFAAANPLQLGILHTAVGALVAQVSTVIKAGAFWWRLQFSTQTQTVPIAVCFARGSLDEHFTTDSFRIETWRFDVERVQAHHLHNQVLTAIARFGGLYNHHFQVNIAFFIVKSAELGVKYRQTEHINNCPECKSCQSQTQW